MPTPLATIALASAVVGTTGVIDVSTMQVSALPRSPDGPFAHLDLENYSGTLLQFTFSSTGGTYRVAPGEHKNIPIPPGESGVDWQVLATFPTAYTPQLFVLYWEYYETPGDLGQSTGVQMGLQPRNVNIPLSPFVQLARNTTVSPTNNDINLRTDGYGSSGVPKNSAGVPSANLYLYWAKIRLLAPAAGNAVEADLTLFGDIMNGGAVLQSVPMHVMIVQSFVAAATASVFASWDDFTPATAVVNAFTNVSIAAATGVRWRLHCNLAVGTCVASYSFGVGIDVVNGVAPGTHGNFTPSAGTF